MEILTKLDANCPRTGQPCPVLSEFVEEFLTTQTDIEVHQNDYLNYATESTLLEAAKDILAERGDHDFNETEITKLVHAKNVHVDAIVALIKANEALLEFNVDAIDLAKRSCLIGPRAVRSHIFFGEKKTQCTSLLNIIHHGDLG